MVVIFSLKNMVAKAGKFMKIFLILAVIFYLLSKLVSLYWNILHGPPVPSEPVVENPLRVVAPIGKNYDVYEKSKNNQSFDKKRKESTCWTWNKQAKRS